MSEDIIALFIQIGICVVVPIAVVWIIFKAFMNRDNRRTEVLIEAIKSNNGIDTDKLAETMSNRSRTPREILNLRLLRGCIFSFIGIALLVCSLIFQNNATDFDIAVIFIVTGLASLAVGISYLTVYFVTRKTIDAD